jgi:choice-of-anchor B domain-containing protein
VSSTWRDIKVYEHYALVVSEAAGHGMQVFDLRRLLESDATGQEYNADANYTGFGNAHNVVVSPDRPIAYAVGTSRNDAFAGGVHFVNLSDPLNPLPAGGYGESGYTHDAQVIRYTGPDSDYINRTLFIGSNESEVVIVDVTELDAPSLISSFDYQSLGYTHQGWFTEDQTYFLLGDELDELDVGFNSRTLVFDLSDLDNPLLAFEYTGPTGAIDHNGYVLGDAFYLANYTAGFREIDLNGIESGNLEETGFFDTFPSHDNAQFDGVWSIYPYLPSGDILINDISSGLFIVRKSDSP